MILMDTDLLIIGAGPVGLYAGYYAGFRGLSTAIMDSLPEPGGQISAMYPEKPIYDIAGFPAVKGRDLVAGLVTQVERFAPTFLLGRQAMELYRASDGALTVSTVDGSAVRARAVIISGGIGTFTPRPLPAGGEWLGRGLSFFVPSLATHTDQDVVVVGGGDSACDWALGLEPIARSVTLVHRRGSFRSHAATVQQLLDSSVTVITDAEIDEIRGADAVETVVIVPRNGEPITRKADAVIAALGFTANLGPIRTWGLDVSSNRYLAVDTTMMTNIPGVFAAGDITDYRGKVRLISVGFGEAATAVNNAAVLIDADEQLFPGHSSDALPA